MKNISVFPKLKNEWYVENEWCIENEYQSSMFLTMGKYCHIFGNYMLVTNFMNIILQEDCQKCEDSKKCIICH